MAADQAYHDKVMEMLSPIGGLTSKPMFGGYGIFHQGDMFALISKSNLYFKVNDSNLPGYEIAGSRRHAPMPYYEVPGAVIGDAATLHEWARTSITIAHEAPPKKKKRK